MGAPENATEIDYIEFFHKSKLNCTQGTRVRMTFLAEKNVKFVPM